MQKVFRRLGFFTAFIIPLLVVGSFYGDGYWLWSPAIFSFLVIPLMDQRLGPDTSNVPTAEIKIVSEEFYYRFVTYVWTFFQLAFMVWCVYALGTGRLDTPAEWALFTFNVALVTGGIGITVAHELGHKKSKLERFYGKALLMMVCYMHFYIEHNRGHHVLVATPEDPATARKDETVYAFWVRSVFGGYAHSWRLENERLRKKNKSAFSFGNEMIRFALLPVLFCGMLTAFASLYFERATLEVPIFFFAQSFLAFSILELVNYVEHYGIMRRKLGDGRYERVNPLHSWNASHLLSNFFLFQLQRHSDHHAYAHKRYQVLDHYDVSPQLPFGYPTMIILTLIPPLWFRVMNKRLEAWQEKAYVDA